jgi:cell division protein FtsN
LYVWAILPGKTNLYLTVSAYHRTRVLYSWSELMVEERRQHKRLSLASPVFVSLDDSKSGLLLDVGQGGVAVASLIQRNLDDVISLAFDLPEGSGQVHAVAEVAWIRDSGHLTGARFLSVDELSRQQLSDWIGAISKPAESTGEDFKAPVVEQLILPGHDPVNEEIPSDQCEEVAEVICEGEVESVQQQSETTDSQPAVVQEQEISGDAHHEQPVFVTRTTYMKTASPELEGESKNDRSVTSQAVFPIPKNETEEVEPQILTELGLSGGPGKSRHTLELILAVVLLSWALVFLGYQMGTTGANREVAKEKAAQSNGPANAAEAPSKGLVPSVEASSALTPDEAPLTVGDTGMVLQVGAMKMENNAEVLAQDLQRQNLPAFVFRHGSDRLYRVAVGPYSDERATVKVRATLEKQGLKPILRRWLPE